MTNTPNNNSENNNSDSCIVSIPDEYSNSKLLSLPAEILLLIAARCSNPQDLKNFWCSNNQLYHLFLNNKTHFSHMPAFQKYLLAHDFILTVPRSGFLSGTEALSILRYLMHDYAAYNNIPPDDNDLETCKNLFSFLVTDHKKMIRLLSLLKESKNKETIKSITLSNEAKHIYRTQYRPIARSLQLFYVMYSITILVMLGLLTAGTYCATKAGKQITHDGGHVSTNSGFLIFGAVVLFSTIACYLNLVRLPIQNYSRVKYKITYVGDTLRLALFKTSNNNENQQTQHLTEQSPLLG